MTFPAWFDYSRDPAVNRNVIALAVYAEMIGRNHWFTEPVEIKGWAWAKLLGTHRKNLWRAINLLVERGYLQEHDRAHGRAPRRFTVVIERYRRTA